MPSQRFSRRRRPSRTSHRRKHRTLATPLCSAGQLAQARAKTSRLLKTWNQQPVSQPPEIPSTPSAPHSFENHATESPLPPSPWSLDPWQKEAIDALSKGHDVVVDAPTTAGKTRIVESYLKNQFNNPGPTSSHIPPLVSYAPNFQACYTCPVKSLANDKLKEMRELFGPDMVGICTGDLKIQLEAPLVVATLESYRNSLLGLESPIITDLVIFDEYHYIQDFSRGSSWQEAMILSPPHTKFLLLSASLANANDFAQWIRSLRPHPCSLVVTHHRPVPLKNLIYEQGSWLVDQTLPKIPASHPPPPQRIPLYSLARTIKAADQAGLTPTIIYTGRRLSCERVARVLCGQMLPLGSEQRQKLRQALNKALNENHATDLIQEKFMSMVLQSGVAYHHSGLPPPLRMALESLVKKGILRVCVATSGLSLGINFSVKSTLIADTTRPGDQGIAPYSASDILQMLGRAGRRGRDRVGYSLWLSAGHYQAMSGAQRESIHPQLRHDPTTFLGLIDKGWDLKKVETLYQKSFSQFHTLHPQPIKLVTSGRLRNFLASPHPLPCSDESPLSHATAYELKKPSSLCRSCQHRTQCHPYLKGFRESGLSALQHHLHKISALDHHGQLTDYAQIARHLPHTGGLYIADLVANGWASSHSIVELAEVLASFSLAYYKTVLLGSPYAFPIPLKEYKKAIDHYYPQEIFPHLYEQPLRGPAGYVFLESHPPGGYIIRRWCEAESWEEVQRELTHDYFAPGDLFSLIYKVSSYLQSLAGASLGTLSVEARELRSHLLRPPLDYLDPLAE